MRRFTNKWPREIRDAIAGAVDNDSPATEEMYRRIKNGTLDGLTGPFPDYPRRTFFQHLSDARKAARGQPRESVVDRLVREAEEDWPQSNGTVTP